MPTGASKPPHVSATETFTRDPIVHLNLWTTFPIDSWNASPGPTDGPSEKENDRSPHAEQVPHGIIGKFAGPIAFRTEDTERFGAIVTSERPLDRPSIGNSRAPPDR